MQRIIIIERGIERKFSEFFNFEVAAILGENSCLSKELKVCVQPA